MSTILDKVVAKAAVSSSENVNFERLAFHLASFREMMIFSLFYFTIFSYK